MRHLFTFFCLFHSLLLSAQQHTVYFESAQDSIRQTEVVTLDSIINLLDPSKAYIVEVTGHTDSIGGIKYNEALSKRRANKIQQYLSKSKILFDISVIWKAYSSPATSNSSEEGLARNRRVEITFTEVIPRKDTWDMPVQEFKLSASKAYLLQTKNGCKLTIKPGSFKVNLGDTVYLLVTEYNDPSDFLAGGLPMSFNKGQQEFMYQSEQMMKIEALVNEKPVELLQMIGLECPEVDMLEGLRLYKFQGKKESFVNIEQKRIPGIVEEIRQEECPKLNFSKKDVEKTKKSNSSKKKTTEPDQSEEEDTNSSKNNKTNTSTSPSNNNKNSRSKKSKKGSSRRKKQKIKKQRIRKQKPNKNKRTGGKSNNSGGSGGGGGGGRFKIKPDTGRVLLLEPDTGRAFLLKPDTFGRNSLVANTNSSNCLPFSFLGAEDKIWCNLDSFKKIINVGHALGDQPIPIDSDTDLNLYFARYKSSKYHGMFLRCSADPSQLDYVRISTKKRFLRRQFVLKFKNTPNHPEYLPFKNTKWIVSYRKARHQAKSIKNIRINDFRILRFNQADYSKKSKEGYFIELKGENSMFRFAAKPKKKKKSAIAFKEFQKLYRTRVESFDDSIHQYVEDKKIGQFFQFYKLLRALSTPREHGCIPLATYLPSCLDFYVMDFEQNNSNRLPLDPDDCSPLRKANCEEQAFWDWVVFYNNNRKQIQKQLNELKENLPRYFDCLCNIDTIETDTLPKMDPCQKWDHTGLSSLGNTITYIGLGVYNLDYVFRLEAKQLINNPVFITTEGDTLLTCWSINQQTKCNHQVFSIIPKFNGLLEHNFLPRISLLQNKENILLIVTPNGRYKCYVDMRNQEPFIGNTFMVKDITETSKTLDGLREELSKVN